MKSKSLLFFCSLIGMGLFFLVSQASAGERFTDNGDGTITDHALGVMWAKTDNQGDIDWKGAERWVTYTFPFSLPAHLRDNWRLPTLKELMTLYLDQPDYKGYETDCGQWVKIISQIRLSCGWVWSSERKGITARVFSFQRGYHYTARIVHKKAYRALAVKTIPRGK
ncbi:MAG: DUF1566 domain-containing protein [Deltaproteobacteria bacterium]|nr:DUF1566 domain-containing protein [Deltaproteobacteria bacterium]